MTSLGPIPSPRATEQCLNNSHGEDLGHILQEEMDLQLSTIIVYPVLLGKAAGLRLCPTRTLGPYGEFSQRTEPMGLWAI